MAPVRSLGRHLPAGLEFLVAEGIVPSNADQNSFKWQTYCDISDKDAAVEEELVSTDHCVVWSRGGIIQRVFRLDLEEDPIAQSLLTWFDKSDESSASSEHAPSFGRSRALVVILRHLAHIYFLHGQSHIVNLPVEVERAFAAPRGIVLQPKSSQPLNSPTSPLALRAPPNSLQVSRNQIGSSPILFSPSAQGYPHPLSPVGLSPLNLGSFALPRPPPAASLAPCLLTLTDPLMDVGLVVQSFHPAGLSPSTIPLDKKEELLHIEPQQQNVQRNIDAYSPTTYVLTVNREENRYSVWRASYVHPTSLSQWNRELDQAEQAFSSDLHRSFGQSFNAGGSTPGTRSKPGKRDSFARELNSVASFNASQSNATRKSGSFVNDKAAHPEDKFTMGPDFNSPHKNTAANRRASSMVARAELSTRESNQYKDWTRQSTAPSASQREKGRRYRSSGFNKSRHSFEVALMPSLEVEDDSFASVADDTLDMMQLDSVQGSKLREQPILLPSQDPFGPTKAELVMQKIVSIPSQTWENLAQSTGQSDKLPEPSSSLKVFVLQSSSEQNISFFIYDPHLHLLSEVSIHNAEPHGTRPGSIFSVTCSVHKTRNVSGASKLEHGDAVAVAISLVDQSANQHLVLFPGFPRNPSNLSDSPRTLHLTDERNAIPIKFFKPTDKMFSNLMQDPGTSMLDEHKTRFEDSPQSFKSTVHTLQNPGNLGEIDIVDQANYFNRYQIQLRPRHAYVARILDLCAALQPASSSRDSIHHRWLKISHTLPISATNDEWTVLIIAIFSSLPLFELASSVATRPSKLASNPFEEYCNSSWHWIAAKSPVETSTDTFLLDCLASARQFLQKESQLSDSLSLEATVLALHILREEEKLDITSTESNSASGYSLAPVLAQLGQWCGWPSWGGKTSDFYNLEDEAMEKYAFEDSQTTMSTSQAPWKEPPSMLSWVAHSIASTTHHDFARLIDDVLPYLPSDCPKALVQTKMRQLTPRTAAISRFISTFSPNISSGTPVDATLVDHFNLAMLESFPEGIITALRCFISRRRVSPPTNWTPSLLKQIGCEDMQMLQRMESTRKDDTENLKNPSPLALVSGLDVRSICERVSKPPEKLDPQGPNDLMKILFPDDTRAAEPARLLNPQLIPIAIMHPTPGSSESEFLEAQQNHAKLVYIRTMSVVTGQALLEYHCHNPLPTQKLEIRLFNTSCKIQPSGITVNADRSNFVEEKVSWAFFHAGVQAGLRITKDAQNLDTSWLYLNKPNDLSNRHAGLLLGLGLNGHLKSMAKWLAFKYLTPKHDMTSIGLLLGLSASHLGTLDSLITRVLSIHLVSLLPPGSAELNLSPLVQTAGTMGIGLLYYNSQHRRMSEKMLAELEHVELDEQILSLGSFTRDEGYRLAAGFALGLINLGKGKELTPLRGLQVEERLTQLATGPCDINLVHILDQAMAGATIAIALIFMKTGLKGVAQNIDIPHTVKRFDNIRPDILLLRVLARNLIMWDEIEPSQRWMWSRLPSDLRSYLVPTLVELPDNVHLLETVAAEPLSSAHLSLYNILAGLCWSVGLKNAGTASTDARDCLLSFYDKVTDFLTLELRNYDQRLTRDALMRFQHLVILSAAVVMAGTGDLAVLTRARVLHATVNDFSTFGFHQAAHMAMGALFLGQGRFTFGTSNLAITSLICAFYPLFPQEVLDNRAHLQAFRHMWVLAAESRRLFARDVETGQVVTTPVRIVKRDGTTLELTVPALLPDLDIISMIITLSDEYWQVVVDFEHNSQHLASFKKHQTIYLRRKSLLAQYDNTFSITMALHMKAALNAKNGMDAFKWICNLPSFEPLGIGRAEVDSIFPRSSSSLSSAQRRFAFGEGQGTPLLTMLDRRTTGIDDVLVLREGIESENRTRLMNILILFKWAERERAHGRPLKWSEWIGEEAVSSLRAAAVRRAMLTHNDATSGDTSVGMTMY